MVKIKLPRLPSVPLPRFPTIGKVRMGGWNAISLSLLAVGLGLSLTMFFVITSTGGTSPIWPDKGAEYILPNEIGRWLPPDAEGRPSQTIQVNIADGALISELSFTNVSLGKTGLTACFQIVRDGGNATGFLFVDELIMTGVSAPTFSMANTEVGTLILAGSADGRTNGATLDNTISEQVVGSTRGAGSFTASNASADRVIISILGDATVQTLSLDNVSCSVGEFDFDHIKAGTITQDSTSRFGTGSGINSPDYVLEASVLYRSSTDSMVDEPVTVR